MKNFAFLVMIVIALSFTGGCANKFGETTLNEPVDIKPVKVQTYESLHHSDLEDAERIQIGAKIYKSNICD